MSSEHSSPPEHKNILDEAKLEAFVSNAEKSEKRAEALMSSGRALIDALNERRINKPESNGLDYDYAITPHANLTETIDVYIELEVGVENDDKIGTIDWLISANKLYLNYLKFDKDKPDSEPERIMGVVIDPEKGFRPNYADGSHIDGNGVDQVLQAMDRITEATRAGSL